MSRNGYEFADWYDNEGLTGTPVTNVGDVVFTSTPVSYYAKWTALKSTFTFDTLCDDVTVASREGVTDQNVSPTVMPTATRVGYTFGGWWAKDGTDDGEWGEKVEALPAKFPAGGATYYAKWNGKAAFIQFATNEGTAVSSISGKTGDSLLTDGKPRPMPETSRVGYEFGGWYATSSFTGEAVTHLPEKMPSGVVSYYAKWNPLKVNIVFESDGGTKIDSMQGNTGETITNRVLATPEKTGYTFGGWFTTADKSGSAVGQLPSTYQWNANDVAADGKSSTNTYYAKWTANPSVIELHHQRRNAGRRRPP